MEPPQQITPTKLADYLEILTKTAFEPGLNWQVIERKWSGFQAAFQGFDPAHVANLSPDEVDALANDERIIRSRKKIEATIHNAGAMIAAEQEFGTFKRYLESREDFDERVRDIRKRFKFVGDFGAYYFLYVVGEPVPEHHEYRAKLLEGAQKPKK